MDKEKRLGPATIRLPQSYQRQLSYYAKHLLGRRFYQTYLESKDYPSGYIYGPFYQRNSRLEYYLTPGVGLIAFSGMA